MDLFFDSAVWPFVRSIFYIVLNVGATIRQNPLILLFVGIIVCNFVIGFFKSL